MSYCVNCGVELDASAEKCVLCNTPVLNPKLKAEDKPESPFAMESHIPKSISRKFVAYIVSVVMFIPNVVCLITNFAFFNETLWSLNILCTSLLLWIVFVFPFFTKKSKPYLMWAFDTAAVASYFYFIFAMSKSNIGTYLTVVLPVIGVVSAQMLTFMLWAIGKKRHIILKTLHLFVDFAVFALIGGLLIAEGLSLKVVGVIGIIVFVSCLSIIAFLAYCYKSNSMRRYLSKRFFA